MPVKGGYDDTSKGTFGKSFCGGAQIDKVSVRLIRGITPDLAVSTQVLVQFSTQDFDGGPLPDPNPRVGHKTL